MTVTIRRTEDPEEREQRHVRIVTSSLQGLELFAARLPAEQRDWLAERLAPQLASAAFWKRAAHPSALLR